MLIPHEARPGAAWNAEHVARPRIEHPLRGGDEDHRVLRALEELDGRGLVGGKVAARRDDARNGLDARRLVAAAGGDPERESEERG
jgi:hypothetical protein